MYLGPVLGVLIFGVPIYLSLRAHDVTAFWVAPAVGFVVGGIVMYAMFGINPGLFVGGPLGALVGIVLWLIDRPDRRAQYVGEPLS